MALSLFVVLSIYGIMLLLSNLKIDSTQRQIVRSLTQEFSPPLPPPPQDPDPVDEVDNPAPAIDLIGLTGGPIVEFSVTPKLTNINLKKLPQPKIKLDFGDFAENLNANFATYDVHELDDLPKIIKSRKSRIPRELRSKGIRRVKTKIQILIDETGRASIKSILDAGHMEMLPVIRTHLREIRFTPPTRNGKKVHANYLFLLNFQEMM